MYYLLTRWGRPFKALVGDSAEVSVRVTDSGALMGELTVRPCTMDSVVQAVRDRGEVPPRTGAVPGAAVGCGFERVDDTEPEPGGEMNGSRQG